MEVELKVQRPKPASAFEAYVLEKLDKIDGIESRLDTFDQLFAQIIEKQEVHDTQFEAIFYCFGKHDERLENLEKQGADLLKEMKRLRADNKVSEAYYNAVVQRVVRLEQGAVA